MRNDGSVVVTLKRVSRQARELSIQLLIKMLIQMLMKMLMLLLVMLMLMGHFVEN